MRNVETDVVLDEINKELNWKERIIGHVLRRTFIKIYKKGIEKGFNSRM